jgi:putative methyltransferase (TIGR04325 family)
MALSGGGAGRGVSARRDWRWLRLAGRMLPQRLRHWFAARVGGYGWFGDYADWESAVRDSGGYDVAAIRDRVEASALAVKRGEAAFERDSVAFAEPEYQWPLLAGLLWAAAKQGGALRVLDFGGSLGSAYFQHAIFFGAFREVRWCVVEQAAFVERGKQLFQDDRLRFYSSIEECLHMERPTVLLFGSVLQYLPAPYELLERILAYPFDIVLVDRTAFIDGPKERITVQRVPPHIYPASYPSWFFNLARFKSVFAPHFTLMAEWPAIDRSNIHNTFFKGFLFARRSSVSAP